MILSKIPPTLSYIRDSIISTGQSNTVITFELVLDMLDNKAKTLSAPLQLTQTAVKSESTEFESDAATALLTYQCKNGQHDPSAKHSEAQCFAKHPHKLEEYRKRLKERSSTPSMHHTTIQTISNSVNNLAASLASIEVDYDAISDGHESEVSLL